jgi:hypothetical protein
MGRGLSVIACVAIWATGVQAQEVVPIPFAPSIPAVYTVNEQRTMIIREDGAEQTSTVRAEYRLEFRRRGGSIEVDWTVVSAEATGSTLFPLIDPTPLIGVPISLLLNDSGNPTNVTNWESIRHNLGEGPDDPGARLDALSPDFAANAVASPLMAISPCQNTSLQVGEPMRTEHDYPVQRRYVNVSKELREIDRTAQTAHIVFERVQGLRRELLAASGGVLTTVRADCIVDLETGVTQNAVASVLSASDGAVEIRQTISLALQSE